MRWAPPLILLIFSSLLLLLTQNKKTVINCSISNDKMEYSFNLVDKFEINDDVEILKSIGMLAGLDTGECTPESLERIKALIPDSLWPYVERVFMILILFRPINPHSNSIKKINRKPVMAQSNF
ncbi:hypothetical protein NQ317_011956 [Molorchus minor]|uniref:Transcription factor DP C-terminal domain-containing protein n=1 Tax=Molorchus minor TaxID=1323400 RepID=A0ABQ9IRF3_9CUCU|nr:hypothetical protein NQ317_011956 [Molorchus minor]